MASQIFFEEPDDFTNRYSSTLEGASVPQAPETLPTGPDDERNRELQLASDISNGGNTVVRFAYDLNDYVTKIKSMASSGDYNGAKKLYDDVQNTIAVNRDGLVSLAGMRNAGKIGQDVADRATTALMSGFNSEKVTSLGRETTLGDMFSPGSSFMKEQTSYVRDRYGFDKKALGMYYGNAEEGSDEKYDDLDRHMMSGIIDPLLKQGNNGSPVSNHMQLRDYAKTVSSCRDDIREAFGDRSDEIVRFVQSTHSESGGMSQALRSIVEIGKNYRSKGMSSADTADKLLSGYTDLTKSVFGPDKSGKYPPLNGDQRRLFDMTLLSTVKYMSGANSASRLDMEDPAFRRAFRETMNEVAMCMDMGVDLFKEMKDSTTTSPENAIGEYIGSAMLGTPTKAGNYIRRMRSLRTGLISLVSGGDDFEPSTGEILSGRSGSRNNVAARLGGTSSCPAADTLATLSHEFLLKQCIPALNDQKGVSRFISKQLSSRATSKPLIEALSAEFEPSFSGPGAKQTARTLAASVLRSVASGRPINIETELKSIAVSPQFAAYPDIARSCQSFVSANVIDDEMKGMRASLVQRNVANGMSEPEAQVQATGLITILHSMKRSGLDYRAKYAKAMNSGMFYYTDKDSSGKPRIDPLTHLPVVVETTADYDEISQGRYSSDADYRAAANNSQAVLRKGFLLGSELRRKQLANEVKD